MFTSQPIGFVSSPYKNSSEIPKGLGAKHDAEGVIKILPEFGPGLTDIEGFSHLFVIWEFDRAPRGAIAGGRFACFTTLRQSAAWCVCHPIAATSEPDWPDDRGVAAPPRCRAACPGCRHARWDTHPRYQTLPLKHPPRGAAPRMAGRSRGATEVTMLLM